MLELVLTLTWKEKSFTYMMKIARAFKMLLTSLANVLFLQMSEIFLRPGDPGHSLPITAALAN